MPECYNNHDGKINNPNSKNTKFKVKSVLKWYIFLKVNIKKYEINHKSNKEYIN